MTERDDLHDAGDFRRYATTYHTPVLSNVVSKGLVTSPTGTYVDATLGGGGHSAALLDVLAEGALLVAIDQDESAIHAAKERLLPGASGKTCRILHGNFGDLSQLLAEVGVREVDGILLDLGVSSYQIDTAERGFSYSEGGPLDMRMDVRAGLTAEQVVNTWPESDLKDILNRYGEERRAPRIAREIVKRRPIETTDELAEAVKRVVPFKERVKTLSRVFQAVRIAVNDELIALEKALVQGLELLKVGGRMAIISYHSLEDRRVKHFFRYGNLEGEPKQDFYGNLITPWRLVTRKPVSPSPAEVEENPRARSARLRIAEKVEGPLAEPFEDREGLFL